MPVSGGDDSWSTVIRYRPILIRSASIHRLEFTIDDVVFSVVSSTDWDLEGSNVRNVRSWVAMNGFSEELTDIRGWDTIC